MKEIKYLGIKQEGIDPRYGTYRTASYSIFECPICLKHYEIKTSRGKKQETCKDCRGTQNVTHGHSSKKYYSTWIQMLQRCNNPKNKKYPIYGGKGIKVDPKWETFEGFWEDMGSTYEDGLTIDRIDSSKDYCKDNCRWLTLSENCSQTTKRRPVNQYRQVHVPTKSWVYEKTWDSAQQAAETLSLVPTHITSVCLGKRKTHGGFKWEYVNEVTNGDLNV